MFERAGLNTTVDPDTADTYIEKRRLTIVLTTVEMVRPLTTSSLPPNARVVLAFSFSFLLHTCYSFCHKFCGAGCTCVGLFFSSRNFVLHASLMASHVSR